MDALVNGDQCKMLFASKNAIKISMVWGKILKILSEIVCDDHMTGCRKRLQSEIFGVVVSMFGSSASSCPPM